MSILSKVKTFSWFLFRPKYYSQIPGLFKQNFMENSKENTRTESISWCESLSVTTQKALEYFTGNPNYFILQDEFKDEYRTASLKQENCPVKMGGAGNLDLLYNLCEHYEVKNVIETGVAYGWSSFSIILSLSKRNGRLCSVDMPYAKMENDDFVGIVVPSNFHSLWSLFRFPDRKGIKMALKEINTPDLCHYDSDKTYSGRMFAYPLLWKALKPGGIFISDDIQDNLGFHDFCHQINVQPVIVSFQGKFIGIIKKDK